jgi:hypothetical protein
MIRAAEGNETVLGPGGYSKAPYGSYASKIPQSNGQYKLILPHYLNQGYLPAGAIITEGGAIPFGWVPTLAVDPLNSAAVSAFYAAGPRSISYEDLNRWAASNPQDQLPIPSPVQPVTFWKQNGNFYSLTGLGAGLPPIGAS